jgi:hypothetical protein
MSANETGCVKAHTLAQCRIYNSPTPYQTVCPQHDFALIVVLRARGMLEFSHDQEMVPPCSDPCQHGKLGGGAEHKEHSHVTETQQRNRPWSASISARTRATSLARIGLRDFRRSAVRPVGMMDVGGVNRLMRYIVFKCISPRAVTATAIGSLPGCGSCSAYAARAENGGSIEQGFLGCSVRTIR